MPPPVNSWVTKVEVKDDDADPSVVLTVHAVGFAEGKPVEVYGYITQNNGTNGAYASFRETLTIPKLDADNAADIPVTVPADKLALVAGKAVTVVTWISEIWPTMLTAGSPDAGFTAAWTGSPPAANNW